MGRVAHTHIRQQGTSLPGWFRPARGRQGGPSMLGSARHGHTERMAKKLRSVVRDEIGGVEPRAILARVLTAPLPRGGMSRTRTALHRMVGLSVGNGTLLSSSIAVIGGRGSWRNVSIGSNCFINQGCVLDATAPIEIGDDVNFGHDVLVTTSAHRLGMPDRRAGALAPAGVKIGDGAWLASRVVVLPGVEIGPGAIVAAGAVVTRSVPHDTLVAGIPARPIRSLAPSAGARSP